MRRYTVLVVVLAIFASLLLAQPSPSRLTIVVEDPAGAPIPRASVQVQHWARPVGLSASKPQLIQDGVATTDAEGKVSFELAPAVYEVFASASAFVPAAASVGNRGETGHVFKLAIIESGGVVVEPLPKSRTGTLLKRTITNGVDNYPYATYSFKCGGNGPEIQKLCHNNWEILFGNSPEPDSFDVTMVTDDRSRIRDLGKHTWAEKFAVPALSAYEEPEREPSVKAVEDHVYLVHARDTDTDLYALFRVEKLLPGERVDITWKVIPKPQK